MAPAVGFLGTSADLWSDLLILVEVLITGAVWMGLRAIRANEIRRHRSIMLFTLAANAAFLVAFLIQDAIALRTTLDRGVHAPGYVFWPVLAIHLAFAFSSFGVAVVGWRIARKGYSVTPEGRGHVEPDVRKRHRGVARFYPWLWGATLVTGLLLYAVVYVFYESTA